MIGYIIGNIIGVVGALMMIFSSTGKYADLGWLVAFSGLVIVLGSLIYLATSLGGVI